MDGGVPGVRRIRINATPDGTAQNSGFTLPRKAVVLGCWLDVRVAEVAGGTKTLDVGPSSDPNGYLAAADVSATGLVNVPLGALLGATSGDVTGGGETVQYTAGSGDWAEFRGDIYVLYLNLVER